MSPKLPHLLCCFFVWGIYVPAISAKVNDAPLRPIERGEVDIMKEGVQLWGDKSYVATKWPAELVGNTFVRSSRAAAKAEVLKRGYLVVVTPTFGQWGGFSEEATLRASGFDRVDVEPFLPYKGAGTNGDTCCVYQKKVEAGDVYARKSEYGVTLWRKNPLPLYEIPKPVSPPVNLSPGPEYADEARVYQGTPAIACSGSGRLWAAWYGGGTGEGYLNYILLATSGDDGHTWSDPKLIIDPDGSGPSRASEPGMWLDPNGKLWLIWNQYPLGLAGPESETWAITTRDPDSENPTWSQPRLIGYPNQNCFCKPIVLFDGTWMWPSSSFYSPVYSRPLLSGDDGATFTPGGALIISPEMRGWQEYAVVQLECGRVWATIRTRYGMGESFSSDKGRTWSPITPCANIVHVPARHVMARLKTGKLLLVKHGEISEKVSTRHRLMAMISEDEGQTWSKALMLDERAGVAAPDGVVARDGTVYIIYDRNRRTDKEILMAVFTEDDVLAGMNVSGKVRLRVMVNKATGQGPE